MTLETVLAWVIGGVLLASALLTLSRMIMGPSVLDRAVASDVMVSVMVCTLGVHAAFNEGSSTLPILISLSLVGFMGSVAVARFVARDRDYPVNFADEVAAGRSGYDPSDEQEGQP